jgi:hypothetical protein
VTVAATQARGAGPHPAVFLAFFMGLCEHTRGSSAGDAILRDSISPFSRPTFSLPLWRISLPLRSVTRCRRQRRWRGTHVNADGDEDFWNPRPSLSSVSAPRCRRL